MDRRETLRTMISAVGLLTQGLLGVLLAVTTLTSCAVEKPIAADFGAPPQDYERKAKEALWARLGVLAERATYVGCAEPKRAYLVGSLYQGSKVLWKGYEVAITYRVKNYVGYSNTDVSHILFDGDRVWGFTNDPDTALQWYTDPRG